MQQSARICRELFGALLLFVPALLLGGCATDQYVGISLTSDGDDRVVQALAAKAQRGDKQAQYELGRRFDDSPEPNGLKKAIKLYRQAASDSGGTMWVYTPSPGGGAPARVIKIETGDRSHGLVEARARLASLQARKRKTMSENKYLLFGRDDRPDPLRSYGNYPRQYLLHVSDSGSEDIAGAGYPDNAMGRDEQGQPIKINVFDTRLYGESFTASYGPGLEWRGQINNRNENLDQQFYSFATFILTSQRIKEIIEAEDIPNIEFVPVRMYYKGTDEFITYMWVINVFNWRNVFDFANSDVIFSENPFGEMFEDRISRRFGDKRIIDWNFLKVNVDETRDGLFLARGPMRYFWKQIFISKPLADKIRAEINPKLPKGKKISFGRFSMNRFLDRQVGFEGQPAEFSHGYQYAGWMGAPE